MSAMNLIWVVVGLFGVFVVRLVLLLIVLRFEDRLDRREFCGQDKSSIS